MKKTKRKGLRVFRLNVRQGKLDVTSHSRKDAERQARTFERDANKYWVRQQTQIGPDHFVLGSLAKRKAGQEVFSL